MTCFLRHVPQRDTSILKILMAAIQTGDGLPIRPCVKMYYVYLFLNQSNVFNLL